MSVALHAGETKVTPRATVLFDGACGLCTHAAGLARRMDRRSAYDVVPSQSWSDADLARFGLTRANVSEALYVVAESGRVFRGAFAINRFLWSFVAWRPLLILLYWAWPLLLVEIAAYGFVARRRAWISAVIASFAPGSKSR